MKKWDTDGSISADSRYPKWLQKHGAKLPNWMLNLIIKILKIIP